MIRAEINAWEYMPQLSGYALAPWMARIELSGIIKDAYSSGSSL